MRDARVLLTGGDVLDVATGEATRGDVAVADGHVVATPDGHDFPRVDVSGLTISFGLWDCHAHPGSLMYDPMGTGFFENVAVRTIRAGANLRQAVEMGVTGVRALGEASDIDLAWSDAYARGVSAGPRLRCAARSLRTTGGHGTSYPRRYLDVDMGFEVDGAVGMTAAVRALAERGAHWLKILLTGGLFSPHESVDGGQFNDEEFRAVMATARERTLPVAAHCGSARLAERFAQAGGRSIEHGYALDERAAAAMAAAGTWYVPTIGVTHDEELMRADGWPEHALNRALEVAPVHEQALAACLEAGVRIATGADLNPIGPRLHAELRMLEKAGMSRQQVLHAATAGGRALNGLGSQTTPEPGVEADLVMLAGNPMEDLELLAEPRGVMSHGRFIVRPD